MTRMQLTLTYASIFLVMVFTGCRSPKALKLVNTVSLSANDLQSLRLDYADDDIHVFSSEDDTITLKEYMNEDKKRYYARLSMHDGELLIQEGERPRRSTFASYVEIYIPLSCSKSVSLHTSTGTILVKTPLHFLGDFCVDSTRGMLDISTVQAVTIKVSSTNGNLSIENIQANTIKIQTTNADTILNQANGSIVYQSTGGDLVATGLSGSGSFFASGDGSVDVSFSEVTGDVFASTKNGNLTMALPKQLSFNFSALMKSGYFSAAFANQLTITKHTALGTVGSFPRVLVELDTRNGVIEVSH